MVAIDGEWMTKDEVNMSGKLARQFPTAHFVFADGTTACSRARSKTAAPLPAFTVPFVRLRACSHLCTLCRATHPRICACGRCGVPTRS
jgi:hypothetical protein